MIDAALTQRRIIEGDFSAVLSRYGYASSTSALYDKVDKFFQDIVHSLHGTLIESEAHTRRDLLRGSSASLDHIITWNLTCIDTCTMQSSTSEIHWVGAECNDHALISCTVGGDLLTYRKGQSTGDLANSPVSMGRSQRRRKWSGEYSGAAGSNTMATRCSRRHGMLQLKSSLKIGRALQSTRYKAHKSLSA